MSIFKFKHFEINQSESAMKVGTDSMILGAFINSEDKKTGLDVGAGTGVLSLMITQLNSEIEIDAVELDEKSAEECKLNFNNSSWSKRLEVVTANFLDFTPEKRYDLIFSNPPFYTSTLLNSDSRKANARHEKSLPIELFLKKIKNLLTPEGEFWIIIPSNDYVRWYIPAETEGLRVAKKINISGKTATESNRFILCFDFTTILSKEQSFSIRDANGKYTQEYIELTKSYHGKKL